MSVADVVESVFAGSPPVPVAAYDGSRCGPDDGPAKVVIREPDALRRIVQAPGELGFARAFVAGEIEIEGDIHAALEMQETMTGLRLTRSQRARVLREVGPSAIRPLAPPVEEFRPKGRRHSRQRDAASIAHHYDVSNEFYRLFLGETMTYSCAVFTDEDEDLDTAQTNKYELIARKLALQPGQRLLDIGCGWGGMVLHAARHHGVRAVGVTISAEQCALAQDRVRAAGLQDQIEIRLQDYRDIKDGPYDAVSSIGMFEHVGLEQLDEYFSTVQAVLRPRGRFLNHAISRPPFEAARIDRNGFVNRYIFPDGELHEVGSVVSAIQRAGFEVRHVESLREHYAKTLRHWVANLERNWDRALDHTTLNRARIWRLYLAASSRGFDKGHTQIHQVLAVNCAPGSGPSGFAHRPEWEGSLCVALS